MSDGQARLWPEYFRDPKAAAPDKRTGERLRCPVCGIGPGKVSGRRFGGAVVEKGEAGWRAWCESSRCNEAAILERWGLA